MDNSNALASVYGGPLPRSAHPSVVHMLRDTVARHPDREAIVSGDTRISYRQLAACVGALAARLTDAGAAGNRIAVLLPNAAEIVIAAFAAHCAGAQLSLLNPAYTQRELEPILQDAQPLLVITDAAGHAAFADLCSHHSPLPPLVVGPGGSDITTASFDGNLPLPRADCLAALQYTGGTTGRSKGVVCRHAAWAVNVAQRAALLPNSRDGDRFLCMTPLFHAYALASAMYPAIDSGGTLVIMPRYKPDAVLAAIERERITYLAALPTIYIGLMNHPGFAAADLSSLRRCVSGAAPLPLEVLRRWESAVGVPIAEGYGLTEATAVLTYNPFEGRRKAGSVGLPLPKTTIEIVDPDDGGTVLGRNQPGEIRAQGPQLMTEYRNLQEETAVTLRAGWLYSGDIGEIDDDGYLFLRDRKKEMAIVGGYNVFPREVEDVLHAHPAIAEAAAIGIPDSYRGEVIHAFIVPRDGASPPMDDILEHCSRHLARYKVPADFSIVEDIPRTGAGKTDRKRLKAEFLASRPSRSQA